MGLLDLTANNYIWADLESERVLPTLENTVSTSAEVLKALIHGPRMSVYELLMMHVRARGTLVEDAASADMALRWDDFVTDYARVATYMVF